MQINVSIYDENEEVSLVGKFNIANRTKLEILDAVDDMLSIVKNYEESATVEDEDLEEEYEAQGTEEDYAQPWQSVDNSKSWQWTVDQMTKNITLKDVDPSSNGYNPNADKR